MFASVTQMKSVKRGTPHGSIHTRDWSSAQKLLRQYCVTQRDIEQRAQVPLPTVNRVLQRRSAHHTNFGDVIRVRSAIVRLLQEAGWDTPSIDFVFVWDDYDRDLYLDPNAPQPNLPSAA